MDMKVLNEKLQIYVHDAEQWKKDHDEVMEKYKLTEALGEVIHQGLDVYRRMQTRKATTFEGAERIAEAYLQWIEVGNSVILPILELREDGFDVEGSEEFLVVVRTVTMLAPRFIETRDAARRAVEGKGLSLDEFLRTI